MQCLIFVLDVVDAAVVCGVAIRIAEARVVAQGDFILVQCHGIVPTELDVALIRCVIGDRQMIILNAGRRDFVAPGFKRAIDGFAA